MIWKIIRAHFWMLDRQVKSMHRAVFPVTVLVLGLGGQWLYNVVLRDQLDRLATPSAETLIASVIIFSIPLFLLILLMDVGNIIYQIYLNPELELLITAPIPRRDIFVVKYLQCSRAAFFLGLLLGILLALFGSAHHVTWSFYPLLVLLLVSTLLLVAALPISAVLLASRLTSPQKIRTWFPVVFVVLPTLVLSLQQAINPWIAQQASFQADLIDWLLHPADLARLAATSTGLMLIAMLGSYRIFYVAFDEGWSRHQEVQTTPPALTRPARTFSLSWIAPSDLRYIVAKEWSETRHDTRRLLGLAQPVVFAALFLMPLSNPHNVNLLRPVFFWMLLFSAPLFAASSTLGIPLMTVLQEGRNMALLCVAPTLISKIFLGKWWSAWLSLVGAWLLVLLITGAALQFPLWQIGVLVFTVVWTLTLTITLTISVGGWRANFMIETTEKRLPAIASYSIIGANLLLAITIMITMSWPVIHGFRHSKAVDVIETFGTQRLVSLWLANNLWLPLVLLGVQILATWGIKHLWYVAIHRLELWQEI